MGRAAPRGPPLIAPVAPPHIHDRRNEPQTHSAVAAPRRSHRAPGEGKAGGAPRPAVAGQGTHVRPRYPLPSAGRVGAGLPPPPAFAKALPRVSIRTVPPARPAVVEQDRPAPAPRAPDRTPRHGRDRPTDAAWGRTRRCSQRACSQRACSRRRRPRSVRRAGGPAERRPPDVGSVYWPALFASSPLTLPRNVIPAGACGAAAAPVPTAGVPAPVAGLGAVPGSALPGCAKTLLGVSSLATPPAIPPPQCPAHA